MAVSDYGPIIEAASREWDIDPNVLRAVMQQESGGKPGLTSKAGAQGEMQIMPQTQQTLGVTNWRDPWQQVFGAAKYLSQLQDRYKDRPNGAALALAAYNAGEGRVDEYLNGGRPLPSETLAYVPAVTAHYQGFAKLAKDASDNATPTGAKVAPAARPAATDDESPDAFLKRTGGYTAPAAPATKTATPQEEGPDAFLKRTGGATGAPAQSTNATTTDTTEAPPERLGPLQPPPSAPIDDAEHRIFNAGVEGAREMYTHAPVLINPESGAGKWLQAHGLGGLTQPIAPLGALAAVPGFVGGAIAQTGREIGQVPALGPDYGNIPLLARDVAGMVTNPQALAGSPVPGPRGAGLPETPQAAVERSLAPPRGNPLLSEEFKANPGNVGGSFEPRAVANVGAHEVPVEGAPAPAPTTPNPLVPPKEAAPSPLTTTTETAPTTSPTGEVINTSASAKKAANDLYKRADEVGGTLTPQFTNKLIAQAKSIAPQTEEGALIAGETPITALSRNIEKLADRPLSLKAVQEIDEQLGAKIDKEWNQGHLSKDGQALLDLQTKFRNLIEDAKPGDVAGGAAGFKALSDARQAWATAMRLQDVERIIERANQTDNPATAIKSGFRTLTNNPSRMRGWTEAEKAVAKDAAERGVIGGLLHVFGSRLIPPAIATGSMFGGGPVAAMASGTAAHFGTAGLRNLATRLQNRRGQNVLNTLGQRMPQGPLQP